MEFDASAYGGVFENLLSDRRLNALDGGTENGDVRKALDALSLSSAFEGKSIKDGDMVDSCVSAVWLYHNFLDDSHTISQGIRSSTGSYWHGIMHRREPDYPNSKYWFRKVGEHPAFDGVCCAAREIAANGGPDSGFLRDQGQWDPYAFIDLVEACLSGKSSEETICRAVQQSEFEILFDYSYRQALGEA